MSVGGERIPEECRVVDAYTHTFLASAILGLGALLVFERAREGAFSSWSPALETAAPCAAVFAPVFVALALRSVQRRRTELFLDVVHMLLGFAAGLALFAAAFWKLVSPAVGGLMATLIAALWTTGRPLIGWAVRGRITGTDAVVSLLRVAALFIVVASLARPALVIGYGVEGFAQVWTLFLSYAGFTSAGLALGPRCVGMLLAGQEAVLGESDQDGVDTRVWDTFPTKIGS